MRRSIDVGVALLVVSAWVSGASGRAPAADKELTGEWRYVVGSLRNQDRPAVLQRRQEGDKLTGKLRFPGGVITEIQGGKVVENRATFSVQPKPDGPKIEHIGEVEGDTIKGKTEYTLPDQRKRSHFDWEARGAVE